MKPDHKEAEALSPRNEDILVQETTADYLQRELGWESDSDNGELRFM
ncbi:MAG: hypothetical protein HQL74_06635 [Magnetococcales bacterium]|nr:hypothetical protein [Magnetococcales bacterium]MBF0155044.1 hypothetical protein [Magnetococcales bacterium]